MLDNYHIKQRFGTVGKHGSICVTERAIKTLKYEWLNRVPIIKNFDHLTELSDEFESWYNLWRPHMKLEGLRPDDVYYDRSPEKPDRALKAVPDSIERHLFQQTKVTGYRLKSVAQVFELDTPLLLSTRRWFVDESINLQKSAFSGFMGRTSRL